MPRNFVQVFVPLLALCSIIAPAAAVQYAVYPGVDMTGSDFAIVENLSEIACLQTCSTNQALGCVGYVYAPYGGANSGITQCFLKKNITQSTIVTAGSAQPLTLGIFGACGQVTTPSPACYSVNL